MTSTNDLNHQHNLNDSSTSPSLVFYLTSNACYAMLHNKNEVSHACCHLNGKTQAEVIVAFLSDFLKDLDIQSLSKVITPCGPGSFTSIRVGLSVALGLQMALPQAIFYTPNFFEVLLFGRPPQTYAVIDSKRGEFFIQHAGLEKPLLLSADALLDFQQQHQGWVGVYDPELESVDQACPSITTLLENMYDLSCANIGMVEIIDPYYVFHPQYKKISNK